MLGKQVRPHEDFFLGIVHNERQLAFLYDDPLDLGIEGRGIRLFWVAVPLPGQCLGGGAVIAVMLKHRVDCEKGICSVRIEWCSTACETIKYLSVQQTGGNPALLSRPGEVRSVPALAMELPPGAF